MAEDTGIDLSQRLSTILEEIKEVMEMRESALKELRQEIEAIERINDDLEKTIADLLNTF